VTLDVLGLRDAKRAVAALDPKQWDVVVNRATRGLVAPQDVERVFGRPPIAVLPADRRVPTAQDRGELVPQRGRLGRAVVRLARTLLEDRSSTRRAAPSTRGASCTSSRAFTTGCPRGWT